MPHSLDELANSCDAVMLESLDGRPHLKQFRAIAKGKPVFIDKPAAGSLATYAARSRSAAAYRDLWAEIVERMSR